MYSLSADVSRMMLGLLMLRMLLPLLFSSVDRVVLGSSVLFEVVIAYGCVLFFPD